MIRCIGFSIDFAFCSRVARTQNAHVRINISTKTLCRRGKKTHDRATAKNCALPELSRCRLQRFSTARRFVPEITSNTFGSTNKYTSNEYNYVRLAHRETLYTALTTSIFFSYSDLTQLFDRTLF